MSFWSRTQSKTIPDIESLDIESLNNVKNLDIHFTHNISEGRGGLESDMRNMMEFIADLVRNNNILEERSDLQLNYIKKLSKDIEILKSKS